MGPVSSLVACVPGTACVVPTDIQPDLHDSYVEEMIRELNTDTPRHRIVMVPQMSFPDSTAGTWSEDASDEPEPTDVLAMHEQHQSQEMLPTSTRRMMHAAYLIADILQQHFDSPANQCEQHNSISSKDILKHIHIVGDLPRQYLLRCEAEQTLYIMVDTRALAKLHLKHLRKCHDTEEKQFAYSQCFLWHHYLNKFDDTATTNKPDNNHNNSSFISECEYILNAKLLACILFQSERLENKLSVYCDSAHSCRSYHLQIVDHVQYAKEPLFATNIHLFDHHDDYFTNIILRKDSFSETVEAFHTKERAILTQYKVENKVALFLRRSTEPFTTDGQNQPSKLFRLSTRDVRDLTDLKLVTASSEEAVVTFVMPVYPSRLSDVLWKCDLSFDFLVIPLAHVAELVPAGISQADEQVDLDWHGCIENGVKDYDALDDIDKEMITHPSPQFESGSPHNYLRFWRLIKVCMECVDYDVDGPIIQNEMKCFKTWIGHNEFVLEKDGDGETETTREVSERYNYVDLLAKVFSSNLCTTWLDFKSMLSVFQALGFNQTLIRTLKKSDDFKKRFVDELHDQDDDVMELFEEYRYPTI